MQVPAGREANHHFLREPCVVRRQAKRWGAAGRAIEPRDALKPECRGRGRRQHPASRVGEASGGSAGSENHGRSRDLGGLSIAPLSWRGRRGKELFRKPMMNEKSDSAIVPLKAANKGSPEPAELLEGRPRAMRLAKARAARRSGGHRRLNAGSEEEPGRASCGATPPRDVLHDAFHSLRKDAAAGADGVVWQAYAEGVGDRLVDLHDRVHRGAYRAPPGSTFPRRMEGNDRLALPRTRFFSGQCDSGTALRNGVPRFQLRFPAGAHHALDAVTVERRKVNWIVDARGFFDNLDRDHLIAMLEKRIGGLSG